jgi:hypothetical protein
VHDSHSFSSVGIGPDVTSAARTFVDVEIGPDLMSATRTFVDVEIGPDVTTTPVTATTCTHESIVTQTAIDNSLSMEPPTSTQFSWAEDAASIPIMSPLTQTPATRDFSALQSESAKPFCTLQHCYHQSRGRPRTRRQFYTFPIHRNYLIQQPQHPPLITCYHPSGKPAMTTPIRSPSQMPIKTVSQLDWDQDPRLRELGRVLGTLGWVRQGQFS